MVWWMHSIQSEHENMNSGDKFLEHNKVIYILMECWKWRRALNDARDKKFEFGSANDSMVINTDK